MVVPFGMRIGCEAVFFGGSTGTHGFFSDFFAGVPVEEEEEDDELLRLDCACAAGTATAVRASAPATPALRRGRGAVGVRMAVAF